MGIAIGAALLVVIVTWGSFRRLAHVPFQSFWILLAALGIQIAIEYVDVPADQVDTVGFGLLMTSYALILGFCFVNVRIRGMAVVTIGIALNALVIALNQGMPTKDPGRVNAQGRVVPAITAEVKHRPERPDDLLPFLGDIIILRDPVNEIISFGDLVLAAGLVDVCYWGSRRPKKRRRRARRTEDVLELEPVFTSTVPAPIAAAVSVEGSNGDGLPLREAATVAVNTGETPSAAPAAPEAGAIAASVLDVREPDSVASTAAQAYVRVIDAPPPRAESSLDLSAYEGAPGEVGASRRRPAKIRAPRSIGSPRAFGSSDDPPFAGATGS